MTTVREYEELVGLDRPAVQVHRIRNEVGELIWEWVCDGCTGGNWFFRLRNSVQAARLHSGECSDLGKVRSLWYARALTAAGKLATAPSAHQFDPDYTIPSDVVARFLNAPNPFADAPAGERWEAANGWVVITPADPPNRTHEAVMQRPKSGGPWLTTPYVTASLVRLLCTPVPS